MRSFSKRRSGGGGSNGGFERILRGHVEQSYNNNITTVHEIVDHLRSSFPQYSRQKLQPFTRNVDRSLSNILSERRNALFDSEDAIEASPVKKRLKSGDKSEERLREMEKSHVIRQRNRNSSSITSSDGEDEEDSTSTSSDNIYSEKFDPEIDLMKSMLRSGYSGSKKGENVENSRKLKKAKSVRLEERNVELEVTNEKVSKKIDFGEGERSGGVAKVRKGKCGGSGEEEVVKRKDGPMFKDLGGMNEVVEELKMEVIVPLYHPQLPQWLGVRPMSGILLHGPPGCGKTKLAHAIANETGVPFYKISATELVSGVSGASEENIRELFSKAYRTAPSIVFIDEIDAIASKRENLQREMERRIVTQLMACMDESLRIVSQNEKDGSSEDSNSRPGYVLVIGATNRPDAVDAALRRPGRFDREIVLGVPDETARVEILSVLTSKLKVEGDFDLLKIARCTPGFVGADLAALANKAGNLAMKRIIDQRKSELSIEPLVEENAEEWWRRPWTPEEMEKLRITMGDFEEAAKMVQPSSRREGFNSIPNVKWEDVGGLDSLRKEFERYIVRRIKSPEDYEEFGVHLETGFLLYGPPGCGKTLIAKAVANEAGANFIHIKGPELLNKYVGESELAVRTIFSRARTCSPCILFFDEVDALTTKRGKEGGWVVERLLNQLLIELDGADQRRGVYVIGATNRPEVMDRALLRPGRLGKLLYVPLPSPDERGLILKTLAKKKPIDATVDLVAFGKNDSCSYLSGADLAALMDEAAMVALEDKLQEPKSSDGTRYTIKTKHFDEALKKVPPSVSIKQNDYYGRLQQSLNPTCQPEASGVASFA
ncbi:cell division control protein 48-like [Heracleum sosnowskyi]|uniref:Cell division control protein 48-like n=1 Tax=Heracleum sosnowskyi TaxID=360622 RepID=A0AAD8NBS7_9APIA|nr:cell division control protein 48-like [Heracleum sosnowskyi]